MGGEYRARASSRRECSLRSAGGCLDEMVLMDPMDGIHARRRSEGGMSSEQWDRK